MPDQTKQKPVRKASAAPAAYKPNPLPRVLQAKTAKGDQPARSASPIGPPAYRPQPVPKVLQTKRANASKATSTPKGGTVQTKTPPGSRTTPAAPPVYRPQAKGRVLQAKQIAMRGGLIGRTVQLSNNKKQQKAKERVAGEKRRKEKDKKKTADNLVVYAGVPRAEAQAAAQDGYYVPGHHSQDSNSKMNDGTKSAIANFMDDRRAANAGKDKAKADEEDDEADVRRPKPPKAGPDLTPKVVEMNAKIKWNTAAAVNGNGLEAMTNYLNALHDHHGLPQHVVDDILEQWGDYPVHEALPESD